MAVGDPPMAQLVPLQIVLSLPAEATGVELTVTVACEDALQPLLFVTVTVYVVVVAELATGFDTVVESNPVEGLHK